MKTKEIIRQLEIEGWVEVRHRGSHRVFKKAGIIELIVLPDHVKIKSPQ